MQPASEDIMILVCHVMSARARDQKVVQIYGYKSIKISYHPAKFGGHRHSRSEDIMVLVCYVIS